MRSEHEQFDDPQLATAVRRVWGAETAPAELRRRISSLMLDPASAHDAPAIAGRISPARRWFRYAAAAIILLAVGSLTYTARNRFFAPPAHHDEEYAALKPDMARLMTSTHDEAAKNRHVLLANSGNSTEFESLGKSLQIELGRRIAAVPLPGWNFVGARLAQIGNLPAAQMVFEHEDECISVFSLDVPEGYPTEDGIEYEQNFEGHPISGFVRAGGLYCLVGSSKSGKLDLEELEELRNTIRGHMTVRPATSVYNNPKIPPSLQQAVKQ